jgi:hypothetical protein
VALRNSTISPARTMALTARTLSAALSLSL